MDNVINKPLSLESKKTLTLFVFGLCIRGLFGLISDPNNYALAISVVGVLLIGGYYLNEN